MPDLTGTKISNTYKRLMQVKSSDNEGITSSLQTIQSGDNVDSPLQLSNSTLNVNGTFAIGGVNLTATVSSLNATADITGSQGYVVVSGTNVYKRTFSAGDNITLTNADGVASNTGIALTSTVANLQSLGVSAVSATTLEVSKTIASSIVSAADIRAATVSTAVLKSPSVSITGGSVSLTSGEINSFTATSIAASVIEGSSGTFTGVVSAASFAGDGSALTNVPSTEGGTVKIIKPGTGLNATVNGSTSTTIPVSGTLNINSNQSLGTVSVSTGLIVPEGAVTFSVPVSGTSAVFTGDVSAANVYAATNVFVGGAAVPTASQIAAVSALTSVNTAAITSANSVIAAVSALTSVNAAAITSANSVIAAVSALTSVNKVDVATNTAAITSINSVIGDGGNYATSAELATVSATLATSIANVSSTMATSIGNTNSALATTSAALATSIGNSNTAIAAVSVLTSVNLAATTSINTVIGTVSSALATSIANVSSTMATSINNSNTNIAAVSVLASVNLARIATTSAALATSIGNQLPKAGGAMTGILSATDVICSGVGVDVDALLGKDLRIAKAAVADIVSLTDGATINVDFNNGQNFAVQLGGNRALGNPSNCVPGQTGSIFVIQDGTGSRTLSFGANYKFPGGTAPTLSTGASACDRIDYITFTSSNIHAVATLNVSTA